jgi:hypothetical protein
MSAEARVLPVSSNTKNERAKLPAMPPTAPQTLAKVRVVKFFVQRVGFGIVTS